MQGKKNLYRCVDKKKLIQLKKLIHVKKNLIQVKLKLIQGKKTYTGE